MQLTPCVRCCRFCWSSWRLRMDCYMDIRKDREVFILLMCSMHLSMACNSAVCILSSLDSIIFVVLILCPLLHPQYHLLTWISQCIWTCRQSICYKFSWIPQGMFESEFVCSCAEVIEVDISMGWMFHELVRRVLGKGMEIFSS